MFSTFLSAIARDKWAIEPYTALGLLPHVLNYMDGKPSPFMEKGVERLETKPYIINGNNMSEPGSDNALETTSEGSIAVIPLHGVLMKYNGECGEPGALAYAERINRAYANENISAIILDTDGPGGQVAGTATLADVINKKTKPVIGFINDGMAASAHMWALSGCSEIILSHKHCMIGSVGVYATLVDVKGAYEKLGFKVEDIYAPQSTEKNRSFREWADNQNKALLEAEFGFVANEFIEAVQANRGSRLKQGDWSKGKLFYAEEGIAAGLADSIGDFKYALQRARKLSSNSNSLTFKFS